MGLQESQSTSPKSAHPSGDQHHPRMAQAKAMTPLLSMGHLSSMRAWALMWLDKMWSFLLWWIYCRKLIAENWQRWTCLQAGRVMEMMGPVPCSVWDRQKFIVFLSYFMILPSVQTNAYQSSCLSSIQWVSYSWLPWVCAGVDLVIPAYWFSCHTFHTSRLTPCMLRTNKNPFLLPSGDVMLRSCKSGQIRMCLQAISGDTVKAWKTLQEHCYQVNYLLSI